MEVCVFGNKSSSRRVVEYLQSQSGVKVVWVRLAQGSLATHSIVDVDVPPSKLLGSDATVFEIVDYAISRYDHELIDVLSNCALGFVVGWQRLLPSWLIDSLNFPLLCWHGSPFTLPHGGGRSPMNWAIRLGCDKVVHTCFRIDAGVDSGPIFDEAEFVITADTYIHDLIASAQSHIESNVDRATNCVKNGGELNFVMQPLVSHRIMFPKLTDSDGFLDPSYTLEQALRIVRATSKPFPGAFYMQNRKKVRVWSAVPLASRDLSPHEDPVLRFRDGDMLVLSFTVEHR